MNANLHLLQRRRPAQGLGLVAGGALATVGALLKNLPGSEFPAYQISACAAHATAQGWEDSTHPGKGSA